MSKSPNDITEYLDRCIASSGRTHAEIAAASGIGVRYIELFRTGAYKVPFDDAGRLGAALGRDPRELFALVMWQRDPGLWEIILEMYPEIVSGRDPSRSDCG